MMAAIFGPWERNGWPSAKKLATRLARHAEEGSLAHALLLTGVPGRGRLALTLALAKQLHCTTSDATPCGTCPSCHQHDRLQHPDLHFTFPVAKPAGKDKALSGDQLDVWREIMRERGPHVDMADLRDRMALSNKQPYISVHEAQDIQRRLSLTAHAGGWKVQVIFGAQFMRVDTANKLLKLLEEPPKKTLFVLLADNTEALLATILSRTQIIPVPPIPADAIDTSARSGRGAPEAIADAVALCDGDLAEARRLLHSDAAEEFEMFVEWMRTCYARDGRKAAVWPTGSTTSGASPRSNSSPMPCTWCASASWAITGRRERFGFAPLSRDSPPSSPLSSTTAM